MKGRGGMFRSKKVWQHWAYLRLACSTSLQPHGAPDLLPLTLLKSYSHPLPKIKIKTFFFFTPTICLSYIPMRWYRKKREGGEFL